METSKTIDWQKLPTVAVVGRVNVGKSTFFNKLTEENKAIISDIPGTTRTNNESLVLWRGKYFRLVDTGGLTFDEKVDFEDEILHQSEVAMKKADIIIFMTDGQVGILPQERELAKKIRRIINKKVFFVANKIDNQRQEYTLSEPEWTKLGLGEPFPISSASGRNIGDLLDEIYTEMNKLKTRPKKNTDAPGKIINVSLIGKPNVGKSSLFNKIIGEEKVIVSDIAHTTREPFDTIVKYTDKTKKINYINFIDTAGIRRKAKVGRGLEKEGIYKSLNSIKKSDIVLFVIDGADEISSQDRQLGGLLEKHGKSVIIIINKWDLAKDNSDHFRNEVKKMIYSHFPHLSYAPIIFTSGKTGYRVHEVFPNILRASRSRKIEIAPTLLSRFLEEITTKHKPSRGKGTRQPKILGLKQVYSEPPIFEVIIKQKTSIHRSYVNYIKNKLHEQFDFFATPIIIKLKKNKKT